jgi:hypothetical protein
MWDRRKKINIYCNNESVIKTINQHRYGRMTNKTLYSPDMDIFLKIFHILKSSNDYFRFLHIKGHQDKGQQPISYQGYLNIIADKLATVSLQDVKTPTKESSQNFATLFINNEPVYSKHTNSQY